MVLLNNYWVTALGSRRAGSASLWLRSWLRKSAKALQPSNMGCRVSNLRLCAMPVECVPGAWGLRAGLLCCWAWLLCCWAWLDFGVERGICNQVVICVRRQLHVRVMIR